MKRIVLLATCLSMLLAGLSFAADQKAPAAKPAMEKKAEPAAAKAPAEELIDINTASEEQLKKIAGIGDEYSKKIIAGRPYLSKAYLVTRNIISGVHYQQIKDLIIARQK